jgi:hypothetical protein
VLCAELLEAQDASSSAVSISEVSIDVPAQVLWRGTGDSTQRLVVELPSLLQTAAPGRVGRLGVRIAMTAQSVEERAEDVP